MTLQYPIQIADYLPLIKKIAHHRYSKWAGTDASQFDWDTVLNEGFKGLNEAVANFDPKKNSNFSAWAYLKIDFAIGGYFRKLDKLNLVSKEMRAFRTLRENIEEKLMQLLGRVPAEVELAEAMGYSLEEYRKKIKLDNIKIDLDKKNKGEDGSTWLEVFHAEVEDPDKNIDNPKIAKAIDECMRQCLDEIQRQILLLSDLRNFKLREVVEIMGNDKIKDENRADYQLRVAEKKMAKCLKKKGINGSDI